VLQIKKIIKGDKKEISVIERFAAGSTAGAIAQTSIYPMEVNLIFPLLNGILLLSCTTCIN